MVARFVDEGIAADETAVVVASAAHLTAFEDALAAGGVDVASARQAGIFVTVDASEALSRFLVEGWPDAGRFETEIGALARTIGDSGRPVRIYGEMVALLWDAGHVGAAIELEEMWNELRQRVPFSLLCAYSAESVRGDDDSFHQLCHCHSAVVEGARTEATKSFAGELPSLSGTRQFVAATLRSWNLDRLVDDASIIISELATNAVLHASTDFVVAVSMAGDCIRLSVRDDSPVLPMIRTPLPTTITGRGLILIAALAERWGTDPKDDGKIVWVDLLV